MSPGSPRLVTLVVVGVYLVLLGPLIVVIGVSLNAGAGFEFPPRGLSLRWYAAFFQSEAFVRSFFRVSLPVGAVTATMATVIGSLAAIALVRYRFRARNLLETFFLLPLLIPQILLGAALFLFYSRLRAVGTLSSLMIAHTTIAVPYVIRTVMAGLTGLNPSLEEAAMSLGATRVQAFLRVTLPLLRSSILSGAVFAFIVSFSDVNLALFVAGPETTTIPVHIFSQIQWEGDPTIAAASALQIVVVGGLVLGVQRIFRLRLVF